MYALQDGGSSQQLPGGIVMGRFSSGYRIVSGQDGVMVGCWSNLGQIKIGNSRLSEPLGSWSG
ncbi:hypothetical protein P154DRAFT_520842 [Amniculicola lignicola CBS 123094]|uniref:Uncharacterized protein n=1 Tax=Amniculicola lignicola CBS 123094 TaxID=1392246 RepID=A0A6A5WPN7_9PLEO|nr:hypothetical protein P154DRAFT_520842 [Amniculicola lignicola CBS 123094]